jgi:RNA polymerase sigma factor (sigma-70 family)
MKSEPRPLRLVEAPPAITSGEIRSAAAESTETDGDASKALEHVVGRFDAFIRRSARRHGLDRAEVDEVVQELRVRMWKSLGTAELIRRAKASYIYRAAISASIDIIRRRRARRFEAMSLDDGIADIAPDPRRRSDAGLEEDELAATVHRAIGLLAESRRAVVRMHLAGYERDEIADLLGWTEPKTRNLLYRGLADLRQILESWGIRPGTSATDEERRKGAPQ